MRNFNYTDLLGTLLTPEISNLLSAIHEYRSKQTLYITARKDILQSLLEIAVIQSTDKSGRIRMIVEQKPGKISKDDIVRACPDISVSFIERTLRQMIENGEIRKIGASRSTAYIKL